MLADGSRGPARGYLPDEMAERLVGVELAGVEPLNSRRVVREARIDLGEVEKLIRHVGREDRLGEHDFTVRLLVAARRTVALLRTAGDLGVGNSSDGHLALGQARVQIGEGSLGR